MRRIVGALALMCVALILAACGGDDGSDSIAGATAPSRPKTDFPVPASVSNFQPMGDSSVNFHTDLTIVESLEFYRRALTEEGLTERTINTTVTDEAFSMVFDGDPSGKSVIVQGTDLGSGSTNINIRREDT